ncbi:MAG: DinB family protein [Chloroflexota bacterium]
MREDPKAKKSVHEIERIIAQQVSESVPFEERENLLKQMERSRQEIETLLSAVALDREIYPGWTKKELVAHLTGWEDGSLNSVQAMLTGAVPSVPAAQRGPDHYNEQSVTERTGLAYEQVFREWVLARQQFADLIREMTPQQFVSRLVFPWGLEGTVSDALLGLLGHEREHIQQIQEALAGQA